MADPPQAADPAARPLAVTGIVAAAWCVGLGLTTLTTISLIGWIAAPRTNLGTGLPGVFRTAVNFWLVSHHAGFSVPHGRVGLLPLGLTLLPGLLLFRGGGWIARSGRLRGRYRVGVVHAALALAIPYAVLAGALALAASSRAVRPSAWQALLVCFLLAVVFGGLGAARSLVSSTTDRSPWVAMLDLLPDRARSLVAGMTGSLLILLGGGAVLFGASLVTHLSQAEDLYDVLSPGMVGGLLLFLVELVYLPNAVIWSLSFAVGPGFSVGSGTTVSPSGVFIGTMPSFPPLAALPEAGAAPVPSLLALAVPFVAGAVGGVLTVRALPAAVTEAAPLWGFVCGVVTGCVTAVLAALSGGPLGGGRMAVMGPSAWQVGLMTALEVGVAAAIAAWVANWRLLRRVPAPEFAEEPAEHAGTADHVEFVDPEPVLATVESESLPEGVVSLGTIPEPARDPRSRKRGRD